MDPIHKKSKSFRKTGILLLIVVIAMMTAVCAAGVYIYWTKYMPNNVHEQPDTGGLAKPVYYQGERMGLPAIGSKESLKLPLELLKSNVDPNIVYETATDSIIITTQDKVVRMLTSQLTATMNEKPFTLSFPIEKQKDQVYVPVAPLQQLYQLELRESEETGAVVLHKQGDVIQWGRTVVASGKPEKTFALRKEASVKSPVYAEVGADETVMIWEEKNGWYYIQLKNGTTGYMRKQDVALDTVETIPVKEAKAPYVPWKPTGNKINMTWEQIVTKSPDFSKIGPMPGLNVISPTWFHIADGQGNLQNLADPAYVKWANGREYQVWALFSNGFDPKRTSEALSTYDKRIFMIKQLLGFAQLYGLQGINIDFENVYLKDKAQLVQFVREMVPLLHEQGLVVSMDVTVKSTNENWSMFLDRKALIESLDYMMVMAYDEHWASSPKSGSVASLPWVERSLVQLMKEDSLPPSKLVLGVPLYTRIWTEETKDGKLSVTSRAVFMDSTPQIIKDKKLTPVYQEDTGQNYVEYREGGKLMRIWLEDETSMKARVELVRKYNLAGIASWRRGYENLPTWELIQSTLTKLP